ncbi:hypothetical protein BU25DRAFT_486968 [Macroventuria anomochaeta]|uniref:Uncharacterized protein n=1 Tax=Macroventuria anomochaeta TaxID=301207 RepID=A0ACB6SIY0_9PLEO|nr:uncharacterized protein BU25DRAFT_486968 [Macroventuria anomochaeta]KAF2633992.1 hypothetical protein BU25DRAFT_486968 [Macroventuria anomochaeta]
MNALQRRGATSPLSRGTIINIISWALLALVISTLIARFAVKLARRTNRRLLAQDDIFLIMAAVFSFGQAVAVSIQWKDATGQQVSDKSSNDETVFQKSAYVSSILFIANLGCAKISISLVMQKLFTGRLFEYTSYTLALFTTGWTLSGIIVTAFQCRLPKPWDVLKTNECIDIAAFGNYLASTNIATEVLLVLVPLAVWTQGSPVGNRLYVSTVFWSRLSIIAAVSAQLYFFNASVTSSSIIDSWTTTLCMQIAQTLSVVSACLPGLHPLVSKDMSDTASTHSAQNENGSRCNGKKFGSLASHTSQPSVDSQTPFEPVVSPYCRPLATHGLVQSSLSCDSYNFPRIPSNVALPLSTPEPPKNIFNRLIRSSSSLDLDPLGTPRHVNDLGCLPAPDWDDDEGVESGRASLERRPTSEYVFNRSKVISMPEERNMFDIGREWNGFMPPLPTPQMLKNPPRAF